MKKLICLMVLISLLYGFDYSNPNITGKIDDNITLLPGNYIIIGSAQVDNGVTLKIGPGVSLFGMVELYGGNLEIIGEKNSKAKIEGNVFVREPSQLIVQFAEINDSKLEIKFGNIILTNSIITDSHIQICGTKDSYIQSNIFNDSCISSACENEIMVYIKDNIFQGNDCSILSYASIVNFDERYLGFTLDTIVENNNFINTGKTLCLAGSGQMIAENNYWNNFNDMDLAIYDSNDDLDCNYTISYLPMLTKPVYIDQNKPIITGEELNPEPISDSPNESFDPNLKAKSLSTTKLSENDIYSNNNDNQGDGGGGCFIYYLSIN